MGYESIVDSLSREMGEDLVTAVQIFLIPPRNFLDEMRFSERTCN